MADTSFGKYRLIAELGHGGMADVFLAAMAGPAGSGFSKLSVIKRLRQNLAEDPEFVGMLVDEARIAARLNHPNVVQTNEVGEVGHQYFLAMEYLDGQPFHRIQYRAIQAKKEGRDPFPRELEYLTVIDALAGLHHAHELADYDGTPLQIVHRDVTPHNIFVTYEGQVKVVDFGIAKAVGRASETRQGVVKGKVRYMAPEQAIGQAVDRRADIFCVGIMLWETAVGRRMWKDMEDLQIVQALVAGDFDASPRAKNPDVPEAIDRICKKALELRPEDRYATAEEFRQELEQYMADAGILVDARRRLGPAVGDMFKDKRAEIKSVIERQLSELVARPSADFKTIAIPLDSQSTPSLTPSETSPLTVSVEDATKSAVTDQAPTRLYPSKSRSRVKRLGAVVFFALVGTSAVVWAMSTRARPTHGTTAPPTTITAAEDVSVSILASAPEATIVLDGREHKAPYVTKLPRDTQPHRLSVSAPGYRTIEREVRLAQDLNEDVQLEKIEVAGSAPPPTAKTSTPPAAPTTTPPPRWGAPTTKAAAPTGTPALTTPPTTPVVTTTTTPAPATSRGEPNRRRRELDKNDPWATPGSE